jgi:hypothetical protein
MRRGFDHLFAEISVGLGRLAPRYALWLRLREIGIDPESLTREQSIAFCRAHLGAFLREHGLALGPRSARRVERAVARHDPSVRSPAEWAARL